MACGRPRGEGLTKAINDAAKQRHLRLTDVSRLSLEGGGPDCPPRQSGSRRELSQMRKESSLELVEIVAPISDRGVVSVDPKETTPWQQASPRRINRADWQRFQRSMAEIFSAFGMNLEAPGTAQTPERFLRALHDATSGYEGDRKLLTAFPTECRRGAGCSLEQVVEGPISFYALCEHHALPFHGFAHVGYVPHERIIGISKLTRLVRLFARRFTVQERLGEQIADALNGLIDPQGVAVHLEAVHLCTQMRGVREERSKTVTSAWRDTYTENPDIRHEFLAVIQNRNPWR
jgi:GTP cyclohydrolase IA